MPERDDNVIVAIGDTLFLHQEDDEPIEYILENICVKLTEDGYWNTVFVLKNMKNENKEEILEFVFMSLLRDFNLYTPKFDETAQRYRNLKKTKKQD